MGTDGGPGRGGAGARRGRRTAVGPARGPGGSALRGHAAGRPDRRRQDGRLRRRDAPGGADHRGRLALLALQRDQAQGLTESGLRVAVISSAVPAARRRKALAEAGEHDVVLLGPEQLARTDVVDALAAAAPGLLVVDEAHCVAEWGHDFRPDYLLLDGVRRRLGSPRVLAMTATAAPPTREEICARLGMVDPHVLVHDADRPGIWLGVRETADATARDAAVVEAVTSTDGAALVYARTRAEVEELGEAITAAGRAALVYHAGLRAGLRRDVESAFLSGEHDTVVATSAFGMGVDRPDVRLVVHAGAPTSLDAYYQEVGRAGRDDEPAIGLLVHHAGDVGRNQYLRSRGRIRPATLRAVLDVVGEGPAARSVLAERAGLTARTVARALGALRTVGAVQEDAGGRWTRADDRGVPAVLAAVAEQHERTAVLERSRVEMVRAYAETTDCRRRVLLGLLGESRRRGCGRCDSCDAGTAEDVVDARLAVGDAVVHAEFGPGAVSVVEEGRVTALFEERGYVTLDTDIALDSGVLRPA